MTTILENDRLTRKQKKELGILPIQVFQRAREMANEGLLVSGMSKREAAFAIAMDRASSEGYGSAWTSVGSGEVGAPDWDAILAFIEGLLELFAKFLPIFINLFP